MELYTLVLLLKLKIIKYYNKRNLAVTQLKRSCRNISDHNIKTYQDGGH